MPDEVLTVEKVAALAGRGWSLDLPPRTEGCRGEG